MKTILFPILALVLLLSCNNNKQESKEVPAKTIAPKIESPKGNNLTTQDSISATGRQVLTFLKANNYNELVKYFSSEGVLFSPYGFIDKANCKKLTATDFLGSIQKKWILTWGSYDGTGEPIKLSVPAYLKKFVYSADYLNAEAVGYDQIVKKGNSAVNLETIFPNHHFIDYHFSGFVQKNQGMDWTSLKLVFEKVDSQYFLVAIIHDQWTV